MSLPSLSEQLRAAGDLLHAAAARIEELETELDRLSEINRVMWNRFASLANGSHLGNTESRNESITESLTAC